MTAKKYEALEEVYKRYPKWDEENDLQYHKRICFLFYSNMTVLEHALKKLQFEKTRVIKNQVKCSCGALMDIAFNPLELGSMYSFWCDNCDNRLELKLKIRNLFSKEYAKDQQVPKEKKKEPNFRLMGKNGSMRYT